jgi:hypothetical protein
MACKIIIADNMLRKMDVRRKPLISGWRKPVTGITIYQQLLKISHAGCAEKKATPKQGGFLTNKSILSDFNLL